MENFKVPKLKMFLKYKAKLEALLLVNGRKWLRNLAKCVVVCFLLAISGVDPARKLAKGKMWLCILITNQ